ncbi:MAG: M23 family metallopeptidase [Anaerolineales bacterium]
MDNSWINAILPFGNLISATASSPSSNSENATQSSGDAATINTTDFKQLLTIMLLSSLASSSSGSDGGSLGISSLMAPIMLTLLEKMLSNQVDTSESVSVVQPKTETTNPEPVNSPHGLPIKGALTQTAHPGHIALDFGAPVGTPVKATMDGKVIYAGWNDEGYGNLVIVENGPYRTYFAHLSKIPVKVGEKVSFGMVIGYSGNTGNSTGPHLHYEVRKNGVQINPAPFTLNIGGK